jgi:hypothetical protein
MTSVNVTTTKNTVTVNGETRVVTVKTAGPQGAQGVLQSGDLGDITVTTTGSGTQSVAINNDAITSAKIANAAVTSNEIQNLTIINNDISNSAAIAGSKISPSFTSNVTITNAAPKIDFVDNNSNSDFRLQNFNGSLVIHDITNNLTRFALSSDGTATFYHNLNANSGLDVTGDISVSGTVDSVDLSTYQADGGSYLRSDADDSFTGTLTGTSDNVNPVIQINGSGPNIIRFDRNTGDTSDSIDLIYRTNPNTLAFERVSDAQVMFSVDADDQQAIFNGNVDCNAGLDVTNGDITGTLGSGVTGTTQSATDDSTKIATTAFVKTAVANLVDSSPDALNTLNELAAAINDDASFSSTVNQNIATKLAKTGGTLTGELVISTNAPLIKFEESVTNKNYFLVLDDSHLSIRKDSTAGSNIVQRWNSDGHVDFLTNVDFASGIDVTGQIVSESTTGTGSTGLKIANSNESFVQYFEGGGADATFVMSYTGSGGTDLRFKHNGEIQLNFAGQEKLKTTSTGVDVTGNIEVSGSGTFDSGLTVKDASGSDPSMQINHSDADVTGEFLRIGRTDLGTRYHSLKAKHGGAATANLLSFNLHNGSTTTSQTEVLKLNGDGSVDFAGNLTLPDNGKIILGDDGETDSFISFNGTNLLIKETSPTGSLRLTGHNLFLTNPTQNDETYLKCNGQSTDRNVELYCEGTQRLETSSTGISVTGIITGTSHVDLPNDAQLKLGDNDEFQIFHQASNSNSIIKESGGGVLSLQTNGANITFRDTANQINMAQFITGGACTFRHGADTRLQTTSTGVDVTGNLVATGNEHKFTAGTSGDLKVILQADSDNDTISDANEADSPHLLFRQDGELDEGAVFLANNSFNIASTVASGGGINFRTNSTNSDYLTADVRMNITPAGQITMYGNVDCNAGLDVTGNIQMAGTGFINIPDSTSSSVNRLRLGSSSDYQIYHNGTNAVMDNLTGALFLKSFSSIHLQSRTNNELMASFVPDGEVSLYYDGGTYSTPKLATTATGVDVNGDLVATGDGTFDDIRIGEHAGNNDFGGIFHKNQSGSEYMMISKDEHTFISASSGHGVSIVGGNNVFANNIQVHPTNGINLTAANNVNILDGNISFENNSDTHPYIRMKSNTGSLARVKYAVWNSQTYGMGMTSGMSYGSIGSQTTNGIEFAMTFQMNDEDDRGWIFLDASHTSGQGAMSLTTKGRMTVAHSMRLGYGESDTTESGATYALDVSGGANITGTLEAKAIKYGSSHVKRISVDYTGEETGGDGSPYLNDNEFQEILTITPSSSSQNYSIIGRITAASGASIHTIDINVALRSNTLPDLQVSGSYISTILGNYEFLTPRFWLKETTTAAFKLVVEINERIYGRVTADLEIISRNEADLNNVVLNEDETSEVTSITSGYAQTTPTKVYESDDGVISFDGALTAGGLTFPTVNGNDGQVLTSDGAGNVQWEDSTGTFNGGTIQNELILDPSDSTPPKLRFVPTSASERHFYFEQDSSGLKIMNQTADGSTQTLSWRIETGENEVYQSIMHRKTADFTFSNVYPHINAKNAHNRNKINLYSGFNFQIGTENVTYGGLNSSAITFQVPDSDSKGFIFTKAGNPSNKGSMAITANGKVTIAHSLRLGHGDDDTTTPGATHALDVSGSVSSTSTISATTSNASTSNDLRKITTSTSQPSGGADGDIWIVVPS